MGNAAPDPILRYLALIGSVPAQSAPGFGHYARSARVIMLRAEDVADANLPAGAA
jgi:hypothetical protein